MTDKKLLKIDYQQSELSPRIHANDIIRVHVCMVSADLREEKITFLIKDIHNQNFHAVVSHYCTDRK